MKGGTLQKLEKSRIRGRKNKGRISQRFKMTEYCKDSRKAGYLRFKKGRILFNNYKAQRNIKILCHVDNTIVTDVERKPVTLSHINSLGQKVEQMGTITEVNVMVIELIHKSKFFSKPVRHLEQQQQQNYMKKKPISSDRKEGTRERKR